MVVYADILLVVNWWIDFLLMATVGRLFAVSCRPWRLALGSLVGGLSCFSLFLPVVPWWASLLIKVTVAFGMVGIGYPFFGWRRFFKMTVTLFGLSAALAGVLGALYFFAAPTGLYYENGVVYYQISPLLLVGLTTLCYGVFWVSEQWIGKRVVKSQRWTVCLQKDEASVTASFLYDSGNRLTEPFSGLPVLLLERSQAEKLILVPSDTMELPAGWRIIPYESVGGSGLLPAFLPDKVWSVRPKRVLLSPCYVAVCEPLGQRDYQGLISGSIRMEERVLST